jgi:hypothetical protein
MKYSDGNQIIVHYKNGVGVGWADSSARISTIEDVRVPGTIACSFNYNTNSPPHLTEGRPFGKHMLSERRLKRDSLFGPT